MVGRQPKQTGANVFLAVIAVLVFLFGVRVSAAPQAAVSDNARLFSADEKSGIRKLASEISQDVGINVVALTTADADGNSAREYLENFYEEQGYIENGARGGIGFLIDLDNRELNLVTQGDAIYYITDGREEAIYDAGYMYAHKARYADAMYAMLQTAQQYFARGIPDGQYVYDSETGHVVRHRSLSGGEGLLAAIAALLAASACCFWVVRSYGTVKQYEYSLDGNADFRLQGQTDRLVNQFETARKIETPHPPQNGGGKGSSERSTVHRSSDGNSYGGGHGRKF